MFQNNFINKFYKEMGIEVLINVTTILEENNIDYYLDFGTLLGIVRDGDFIPWDNDLDITILKEKDFYKIPAILKEIEERFKYSTKIITFEESNLKRKNRKKIIYYDKLLFTKDKNFQIAKVKKKSMLGLYTLRLDIFFKYEKDGFLNFVSDGKKYKIDANLLNCGLTKLECFKHNFYVPKKYQEYLSAVYGNWQKPDSTWSKEDCITLVKEDRL